MKFSNNRHLFRWLHAHLELGIEEQIVLCPLATFGNVRVVLFGLLHIFVLYNDRLIMVI